MVPLNAMIIPIYLLLNQAGQVNKLSGVVLTYLTFVLPLVFPGLVATSIYALIQCWNEYIMAYVLLNDQSKETLPVWLVGFVSGRGIDFGPLMAGATLMALPVVLFFVLIQRHVVTGLTAGAVKG
jgi:N,N'-diacetylchitobiose transport system permease protein